MLKKKIDEVMLVLQNINEFIKLSNNLKKSSSSNLNHSNCIVLTNKLKQINNQFFNISSTDLCSDFFSNIYCLLDLFGSFKIKNGNVEDLLESCLDILISCTDTTDTSIQERFLGDFRFLPVITNILG